MSWHQTLSVAKLQEIEQCLPISQDINKINDRLYGRINYAHMLITFCLYFDIHFLLIIISDTSMNKYKTRKQRKDILYGRINHAQMLITFLKYFYIYFLLIIVSDTSINKYKTRKQRKDLWSFCTPTIHGITENIWKGREDSTQISSSQM